MGAPAMGGGKNAGMRGQVGSIEASPRVADDAHFVFVHQTLLEDLLYR